jgi:hypothetical protein
VQFDQGRRSLSGSDSSNIPNNLLAEQVSIHSFSVPDFLCANY